MAEKFSIAKQLDIQKLNEKFAYFVYENGYIPYIFANSETLTTLMKSMEQGLKNTKLVDDGILVTYQPKGLIAIYQDYKVFEDNILDFGEIELR